MYAIGIHFFDGPEAAMGASDVSWYGLAVTLTAPATGSVDDIRADQDIPQLARFVLLRALWPELIDVWRDHDALRREPAARRLLDAGADPADVRQLARAASYAAAFGALYRVDSMRDTDGGNDLPGWCLVETGPDDT